MAIKSIKGLFGRAIQTQKNPQSRAQKLRRAAKAAFGFGRGMFTYPLAWFGLFQTRDDLAAAVAELLIVGFYGANSRSLSGRLLARQVRRGEVGGVFFVRHNIGTLKELTGLIALFRAADNQPLIAIDHEGGVVQRLTPVHGASRVPAARTVAATLSPRQAHQAYARAGREIAALGFNLNLGPVLDFDDPANPAIGRPKRSYGTDPGQILAYAEAFVAGFASAGVFCAAKHFPGHGHSAADSHYGVADISARWSVVEMEPFARLFVSSHPPGMVMMGHLRLDALAPDGRAATLSAPIVTGLLREKLGYSGVIVTDDIDMDAISHLMRRKQAFVQALAAGNDLIMIKNLFGYDPLLPQKAVGWVREAIADGVLNEARIIAAAERVRAIRRQLRRNAPDKPKTPPPCPHC
ncbi:MAG: beta-N-acetylhexosaminidase [Cypionkella sp.]|nr:beta-N-acetylhexosaminidase [Cypionkella sp.]